MYCILSGLRKPNYEWDSYGDVIDQGHDAYRIGYNDGYIGKDLPHIHKCPVKELETIYRDGYDAGKKIMDLEQELKECKASFCTLLPDFLAKK